MTTAATSLLGLALPVTGELSGTWGDTVNNSITSLLDTAIAGTTTLSTDGDVTLSTTTLAANQARQAILLCSGARTAIRTITAPAQSKIYTIINATTGGYAVKIVGVGPTTGISIPAGQTATVAWNGSDFVDASNYINGNKVINGNLTVNGNTTLGDANTDTLVVNAKVNANLLFTDNTYDIGASGANRPRTLYLGTSLISPAITNSGLTSGRVVYSTTGGAQTDSANLLYSGTDLTVYGLTVGRGAGAVSTNTAVGASALTTNSTGSENTAYGYQALKLNSTGAGVTAIGNNALVNNTASNNTAVGGNALNANTSGTGNVAVGNGAFNATNGALGSNTTGSYNTALGMQALLSNTTSSSSTAIGYQAGYSNTTALGGGVLIGYQAGYNVNAFNNALGYQAMYGSGGSVTGASNSAFGYRALYALSSGASNVAIGDQALLSNTTASNNTAVGYQAAYTNSTASYVNAFGNLAAYSHTAGAITAIGNAVLYANTTGANNVAVGGYDGSSYATMRYNTTGSYNTALGYGALSQNTTASYNTAIGYQAGYTNTTSGASVFVGANAGYSSTGADTTAVGSYALFSANTGAANTALGKQALYVNTSGAYNLGIGNSSLISNTTGSYNTAVGTSALLSNTTASNNTAVGYQAGYSNQTGGGNTVLGYQALYTNATTSLVTAVGRRAGFSYIGSGGNDQSVFIGNGAGESATTGIYLTLVGPGSGFAITTGSKNTILGAYSGNQGGLDIRTLSNYIVLSDGDGNPRAYWDADGRFFNKWSTAKRSYFQNTDATAGNCYGINIQYPNATPNGTGNEFIYCDDASGVRMYVRSNGGISNFQANDTNLSDRREKINFLPAGDYLEKICAIPVQTFNYIDQNLEEDDGLTLGVVAQDVQVVAPELVMESNWGTEEKPKMRLSIYQTDLQYALMKCIQEQQALITQLTERITALESK